MKRVSLCIRLFMGIGYIIVFTSCSSNAEHEGEFEFDYYPENNVYYDISNAKYFYSLDAGKSWENFSAEVKESKWLGKKEKIYSKSQNIWKENEAHLQMYEGKSLQVINDLDKNYVATVNEITDKRPVSKTSSAVRRSKPEPKKKGVKGFFNRIFGKKEKK